MKTLLVTGTTGFVGKVLLFELLRRREELQIGAIHLIIRPKKDTTAEQRLAKLLTSPCFASLKGPWQQGIHAVAADLCDPQWPSDHAALAQEITHVLHCAASVDFDLPVAEAATINIDAALNVLGFAKTAPNLRSMTSVSTAYVTPHTGRHVPVYEVLAPLPVSAAELKQRITDGVSGDELERLTGHPNTYTLTKCIAEHLLSAGHGDLPLTIVRPSVVSASLHQPMPGWIDSAAAFGGYAMFTGIGLMKAFAAHPDCRLDIVPVDYVATQIIEQGLVHPPQRGAPTQIRHLTAGAAQATRMDLSYATIAETFRTRPANAAPDPAFMGPPEHGWGWADLRHRALPTLLKKAALSASGDKRTLKKLAKADATVRYMNQAFWYFTNFTFDFRSSVQLDEPGWSQEAYVRLVCQGLYRHVLKNNDREARLVGRKTKFINTGRASGSMSAGILGSAIEAGLRKAANEVTVDLCAFEEAVAAVPHGNLIVLAPNHRSYLDFLLVGWLCQVRPGLGLKIPRSIAAAEFAKIPVVGELFRRSGAVFVDRGQGGASASLNRELAGVAAGDAPLLVFLEGRRSRSREFLPPKRGILRGLQATGRPISVIPIGISTDRVPEESDMVQELRGDKKAPMQLRRLAGWAREATKGSIDLGRMHLTAGAPLSLDETTDVHELATRVMDSVKSLTWPTTWHIERFARNHDVDADWLASQIVAAGGRVLESKLDPSIRLDPALEPTLTNHWSHWLPELEALKASEALEGCAA